MKTKHTSVKRYLAGPYDIRAITLSGIRSKADFIGMFNPSEATALVRGVAGTK